MDGRQAGWRCSARLACPFLELVGKPGRICSDKASESYDNMTINFCITRIGNGLAAWLACSKRKNMSVGEWLNAFYGVEPEISKLTITKGLACYFTNHREDPHQELHR